MCCPFNLLYPVRFHREHPTVRQHVTPRKCSRRVAQKINCRVTHNLKRFYLDKDPRA